MSNEIKLNVSQSRGYENVDIKTISSREVAEMMEVKEHSKMIRKIDQLISRNPETTNLFIKSSYKDSSGKRNREYQVTKEGLELLLSTKKLNTRSARFEFKFANLLKDMFPNEVILEQYPVLNYRVDFLLPFASIVVEYDEKHHKYQSEKDEHRMREIIEELSRKIVEGEPLYDGDTAEPTPWMKGKDVYTVIRINEGEEIDGLRRILLEIENNTSNNIAMYLK